MGITVYVEAEVDLGDVSTADLKRELESRRGQPAKPGDEPAVGSGGPISYQPDTRLWDAVYLQASKGGASDELRELIHRNTGKIV
jgi:hypothetical protein